ncbi:hypothetical protein OUZ56_024673 [Daphnia magna]|uniref:Uncharacterized protein n=1 Tax=Daphnia magna TaxID=35525 RepID=A0ABR0B166_9CRUS|nr:hypothetical protein OUZ56_024673 [Daphnia magna]
MAMGSLCSLFLISRNIVEVPWCYWMSVRLVCGLWQLGDYFIFYCVEMPYYCRVCIAWYAGFHGFLESLARYLVASKFHLSLMAVIPVSSWIRAVGVDLKQPRMDLTIWFWVVSSLLTLVFGIVDRMIDP